MLSYKLTGMMNRTPESEITEESEGTMIARFFYVWMLCLGALVFCSGISWSQTPQQVSAKLKIDGVHVSVDGKEFTTYLNRKMQKYPYFYPVNGPASGLSITTESSEPYPHHHSLFFGCDKVNGGNYWQETLDQGQIISRQTQILQKEGNEVIFTDLCEWKRKEGPSPFADIRRIIISAPTPDLRIIDFEITLVAMNDVQIEKTNHSLFSARMVPALSVEGGGTLVNAQGDNAEEGTFGKESSWCDYWGSRDGVKEGLAIFVHPKNRWSPSKWFTRDYGFFSPTPMNWLDDTGLKMAKAEQLHLKYRCLIHKGDTYEADVQSLYEDWANKAQ
ncbi:MAG TPA: PmoA family protein [bacterium]|nr:PmoA family protein [bacterium]HPO09430.1 PmoA family protein [bacterium]